MYDAYELWLNDPAGQRINLLDSAINWSLGCTLNNIGWWSITLPGTFDVDLLRIDSIVEFWRAPSGGKLKRQLSGFLRAIRFETNIDGLDTTVIKGPDVNELMARRIVAYAAGESEAIKTDNAGDIIKAIARENLGALAPAARDLTNAGFSVQNDLADGQSITKGFSWRQVFRVIQDISGASQGYGSGLYWAVVPTGVASFQLQTFADQPGMDRTFDSGSPVMFGVDWGNLASPTLELDYSEEITYVYGLGQGQESAREVVEIEDIPRSLRSPWGRREAYSDARNESSTAGVTAAARKRLREGEPRLYFTGELLDMPNSRYGLDWEFGDKVTVTYRGYQLDGVINAIRLDINSDGKESIQARLEVEDTI
jgi:hypothetical protein